MKFCATTLGCKVNQFETQAIEGILISRGHELAKPGEGCDACIINTCAVTAESARKSRQVVRRMRKMEPGALVAVCGCYSQLEPTSIGQFGADLAGGSGNRLEFALAVEKLCATHRPNEGQTAAPPVFEHVSPVSEEVPPVFEEVPPVSEETTPVFEDIPPGCGVSRTRALLKIQDGCSNYCAYCIVPYLRGPARSLPISRAAEYARLLAERGFREIVVTGIEISSYGKDLDGAPSLPDAVREICAAAPKARIRLGSLDPGAVTGEFCLKLGGIPNLCDHFHLSLQSGCDDTLRRMGRKYGTGEVRAALASLRRQYPGCGITADLIAGFPGETDEEFAQTMGFIKAAGLSDMHIFPFSPRPGTLAADMPGQVEKGVKRERARAAAAAAEEMAHSFRLALVGKTVEVLFERKCGGYWTGHSANYVEVSAKSGGARNSVCCVRITDVKDGIVWGEIGS